MDVDPAEAYASLSLQRGVGPVAVALARDAHGSLAGLVEALRAGRLDPRLAGHASAFRRAFSRAELRAARRLLADWRGAGDLVLHLEHSAYPPSLAAIHDPPPLLFVRGALPAPLSGPAGAARVVAVVGTRRAGPWALAFARDLGRSLAAAGVTVVSGLALGVDGAAHRGALEGAPNGTVAVLGAGFDHLHPPTHRGLAGRIVRGGALVAEHPPDVRLAQGAFPRRNRLISGLARSVAVVEAPLRSGVRHTVEFALQQGRDVFVVPQRPDSEVGRGACALLRDGAAPLASAADLLDDLPAPLRPASTDPEGGGPNEGAAPEDRLARAILAALDAAGAASLERLLPPGVAPGAALAVLTELERAGRIAPDGAGRWRAIDRAVDRAVERVPDVRPTAARMWGIRPRGGPGVRVHSFRDRTRFGRRGGGGDGPPRRFAEESRAAGTERYIVKRILVILALFAWVAGAAMAQGLTVWTTFNNPTLDYLQQDVAAFGSAFGVEVDVVKLDINELKQQMLLSAPQGEAGDVIVGIPHDQMAEMAVGGVLSDLTNTATDAYLSDLGEQARLAFTYNGRLFGLPLFVEGPALLYNRDLLVDPPASYDALIAVAQELTTSDTFGFMHDINNFYFSYGWLHTFGGYVFGRDAGALDASDVGLANEGAVRGARELQALRFEHEIIPAGTNYDVANGLFIDGALAMFYTGPWAVGQAREAGIDVGVAPMPPLADGTPWSGFMGVQGVLVNQFSEARIDAINLAKWLTRSDAQLGYAQLEGRIPASQSALAEVSDDPIVSGFGEALLTSEPMPNIPEMGQVWGPMANALGVITESADADVEAALEQAVTEILGQ